MDAERESALAEAYKRGLLSDERKSAYEEAINRGLIKSPTSSRLERFGQGMADVGYGASQIGARMMEPGEGAFAPSLGEQKQETVDKFIKEREQRIQAARPREERGTTDWWRLGGSALAGTGLAALSVGPMGATIPGAIAGGAIGSVLEPETDTEHFGAHKAAQAGIGAAAGGVLGVVGKGAGMAYQALRNPESHAIAQFARAAEQDGTTLERLQQRLTEARTIRPDATLADVAGHNVRGLVERIGQTPGKGFAKLFPRMVKRQQEQLERIRTDLTGLGQVGRTAVQAIEQTGEQRAAAATPLYRQAYEDGDRVVWNTALERLTASREVETAMHTAVSRWQTNAIAEGYGAMNPGAIVRGEGRTGVLDFEGGRVPVFPNLQFWDYTKKALDGMVGEALQKNQRQYARDLTRIAQMLREQLDFEVPSYQAARAAWAGPTQYLNAIEFGRGIMTDSAEDMAAVFNRLAPADQDAFRVGAISTLRHAMGNTTAELADFTIKLRSPNMQEKIMTMMPSPEAAQRWVASLAAEKQSSRLTGLALKGSQTARRMAQLEDAKDGAVGDLIAMAFHAAKDPTSLSMWTKLATALPKKVRDTLRSRSDNILIDILTTPEGAVTAGTEVPRTTSPAAELTAGALAPGVGSALGPVAGGSSPE